MNFRRGALYLGFISVLSLSVSAQIAQQNPVPLVNVGGTYMESQFSRLEFAQKVLEKQNQDSEEQRKQRQKLIDSGTVSALDLQAPGKAISEFNKGADLLQQQKAREAIAHLEKAITAYPKFISAHNDLGLAYQDVDDTDHAKAEFELATKLDEKFAGSFVNLGRLALAQKDFPTAESQLERAAALRPTDAGVLTALAYAQQSSHEYHHAIETVERVHSLPHKGLANAHYVAAAAAIGLENFDLVQRELGLFLQEDPANPLAPTATYNLKLLASRTGNSESGKVEGQLTSASAPQEKITSYSNPEALKNALAGLGDEDEVCADCAKQYARLEASLAPVAGAADTVPASSSLSSGGYKIREVVDEVAVFFSVTHGGGLVNNLEAKDLAIRDDGKQPTRVLEFSPQSKLPLRLALLIDTSGSLTSRFKFEKQAASRFVEGMLRNPSDLAFVAGFANDATVTQDFSADTARLSSGIERLTINGGTAIWDAVSFACWKLAAFPEKERVAKVLVVLTDGEDNASRITLKQAIQDAEATGVTVYAISTRDYADLHQFGKTDADRVLQALTERSGGEAMFPGEIKALDKTFARLRDVIRSRYLIAYKPADFQANGHFRKIEIIASRNGSRMRVHARHGYYAPLENR